MSETKMELEDEEPTLDQIGMWVRLRRTERDMTAKQLSERISRSRSWVSHLENGRATDPSYPTLVRIAHTFGHTIQEMLTEASEQSIHPPSGG